MAHAVWVRPLALLLLLPLSLRLLGTYAILSGPWSLIVGVVSPFLSLLAVTVAAAMIWKDRLRLVLARSWCSTSV